MPLLNKDTAQPADAGITLFMNWSALSETARIELLDIVDKSSNGSLIEAVDVLRKFVSNDNIPSQAAFALMTLGKELSQ